MKLNTEYWGEGVYSGFKDLYYAGTDAAKTFKNLIDDEVVEINEKIDPSVFYTCSYASDIAMCTLAHGRKDQLIVDRTTTPPFANYGFVQCSTNYSTMPSAREFVKQRLGYGMVSKPTNDGWDNLEPVTRYALAKIRACCFVAFKTVNSVTSDDMYSTGNYSPSMSLKDFINSEYYDRYVNKTDVIVTGLHWKLYVRGDSGVHQIRDNLLPMLMCEYPSMPTSSEGWLYPTGDDKVYGYPPILMSSYGFHQGGEGEHHSSSENSSDLLPNTSDLWNVLQIRMRSNSSWWNNIASLPPENLMKAFHEFAFFGLYYTNNTQTAINYAMNDDDLFLGVMSPITGMTSGKYIQFSSNDTHEEATSKAKQANLPAVQDTDPMEDPNPKYVGIDNPDDPRIDTNDYITATPLARPTLSPIDVFNRTYAMTAVQIRALADFLWNADDDKMTEILKGLELYGENPLNGLIDCRLYPFDLSGISVSGQEIIVGRVNTEVYGRKILNNANAVFDLGKCKFMKYFNNFLDYAPYTTGRLFLPYCGMVPIDTAEFMGKEISCKLVVDLITGACCCCIFLDEILTITANGMCGVEISMTGTDSAAYASSVVNQFTNSVMQVAGGAAALAGGAALASTGAGLVTRAANIATPNNDRLGDYNKGLSQERMGGASSGAGIAGLANGAMGFWNMQHTPTQYAQRGSSTPSCETRLPQYPFFIIDSPVTDIPEGYGHNVGFACIETDKLSSFSGFTICSNVDTSGFAQATEAERNELKMLLEAGVFL